MTRAEKDNYWMDLIQQCRVSGMSDYAWCNQNGISISSFYYNVRRLRTKACIPDSVAKVTGKQEVVPIHYNELQKTKIDTPKMQEDSVAIRLEYNGIIMAIRSVQRSFVKKSISLQQKLSVSNTCNTAMHVPSAVQMENRPSKKHLFHHH